MATANKDLAQERLNYIYKAFYEYFGESLEHDGGTIPPPVNVIRAEDVQKMNIRTTVTIPEQTRTDISDIVAGITGIKDAVGNVRTDIIGVKDTVGDISDDVARKLEPRIEAMAQSILEQITPKPEEKAKVGIVKRVIQWLRSKYGVYLNLALMLATSLFFLLAGLYALHWSDDAWARRAYDVGVRMEMESPGDFYHETRMRFITEERRTAKAAVLDMEEQAKENDEDTQVTEEDNNTDVNINKNIKSWMKSFKEKMDELDRKVFGF